MPPSSIIVSFDVAEVAVSRSRVNAAGENDIAGFVVSGLGRIETVKVPLAVFPATSVAVAVQTLVVFSMTVGAVKVDLINVPPFVH